MKYIIAINTNGVEHPPFAHDSLQEALDAVEKALADRFYKSGSAEAKLVIQLGTGTIVKVLSEKAIADLNDEQKAARRSPLILPGRDQGGAWKLVVQLGPTQLPPVDFETEAAAEAAVMEAVKSGVFRHVIESEHDYLWIQTGAGVIYMMLPKEQYDMQRRQALERRIREANAAPTGPGGGRIIHQSRRG